MQAKANVKSIFRILKKQYPATKTALQYSNPLEILVSTILSAQCTDKRVNLVTVDLFKKYKTIKDYAGADIKVLQAQIRSTGFYKAKSKNIINAAKKILKDYKGKVPASMDELIKLPGVARKTANIVLYSGFRKIEGVAIDTHVGRLSQRLGFSKQKLPVKIEKDLMKLFPKKQWGEISLLLISHGRAICTSRSPKCLNCVLGNVCPSKNIFYPE